MKNKIIKILSALVILCMTMAIKSNAANLNLSTNVN